MNLRSVAETKTKIKFNNSAFNLLETELLFKIYHFRFLCC